MKGTIDIQIKRKDGTIENRREHNVIFDIPSLTFKMWSESPLAIITGLPTSQVVLTGSKFATFALSEDTISTTEPSVVPAALETVTSSPSKWYYGPTTITTTSQSKSISATWTIGEALTLKSIFFYGNSSLQDIFYNRSYQLTSKDNIYTGNSDVRRFRKELMDFSGFMLNESTSWNGLVSSAVSDAFETAYVDYPLCNPDERFVFSYQSNGSTVYVASPTVTSTLEIRNKDTNTVIRSFPLTQFTGFDLTSSSKTIHWTYVVNTGTKNVLAAATSDGTSLNLWQIPDTATTEAIPISATVLTDYCHYYSTRDSSFKIAGPYIAVQTKPSTESRNVVRINDDFSATTYHGWAGDSNWKGYYYDGSSGDRYPTRYRSGKMYLYRGNNSNNGGYVPLYPNITASNFSTPIVLAEGDVLTVSYKIEVA